jgi:transposase
MSGRTPTRSSALSTENSRKSFFHRVQRPVVQRDYEYKRLATVSLLAGLDLHIGRVTEMVCERHKSRHFIASFSNSMRATRPAYRFA